MGVWQNLYIMMASSGFTDFIEALLEEFRSGFFLFNSPWDIFVSVIDITVTAFAIFYILKIISETRAWQLLKGILWLIVFTLLAGWFGLRTINFALVNSISILALGLVVIFQPELRRALESVGRNSISFFGSREDDVTTEKSLHNFVESIVVACESMSEEYTGALIIIERKTKLGDLIESGTAVVLDAELTSTSLRQIFYKNSPMHDGAVLIRGGRIYATRVHVPLSDSYQLRKEMGTRHRAAIGASEIGDTISIVVSEEHGTISIAVRGRLYTLENADALRTVLHRLLNVDAFSDDSSLPKRLRKVLRIDKTEQEVELRHEKVSAKNSSAEKTLTAMEEEGATTGGLQDLEVTRQPRRSKIVLLAIALAVSLGLWLYVRVTTNPITSRTFQVPLLVNGVETLAEHELDYFNPVNQVTVTVRGRENSLEELLAQQIKASINFSEIDEAAIYELPVQVSIDNLSVLSYEITVRNPGEVAVNVYEAKAVPEEGQ